MYTFATQFPILLTQRRQIVLSIFRIEFNGLLTNERIDRRLDQFAMQLLHDESRDNDARIMAGGVVQLNMSLMSRLVSALTVLLLIMIQFDANRRMK